MIESVVTNFDFSKFDFSNIAVGDIKKLLVNDRNYVYLAEQLDKIFSELINISLDQRRLMGYEEFKKWLKVVNEITEKYGFEMKPF